MHRNNVVQVTVAFYQDRGSNEAMNIQSELPKSGAMWQRHLMITYLYWFRFLTVINVHQTTCPRPASRHLHDSLTWEQGYPYATLL